MSVFPVPVLIERNLFNEQEAEKDYIYSYLPRGDRNTMKRVRLIEWLIVVRIPDLARNALEYAPYKERLVTGEMSINDRTGLRFKNERCFGYDKA